MTSILSWNIQNGKSPDGSISLRRVKDVIASMGTPDVICLQEVSRGLTLEPKTAAPDQIAELGELFPEHEVVFGIAVDALTPGSRQRWQYGNAVLTRLAPTLVLAHPLPRPGVAATRHMLRQATEVVVADASGPLRIVNLHLEFHSARQRLAQVERLRELQLEAQQEAAAPPRSDATGPYQQLPRPVDGVFCGDFNLQADSEEYRRLLAPLEAEPRPFADAWTTLYPGREHDPTCGVHDRKQWPEGPHCRDFFFTTGRCTGALRALRVDTATSASDHQPLMLELGARPG